VYYERPSSFLTTSAPTDVLLAIAKLLEQQCIEFAYSPNKHKIRGVVLAHGSAAGAPANFIVRVWRQSSANAFLCEFQRRSGCVVVFTNFYRAVTASLAHLIMGAAKPKLSSDFDAVLRATEPLPLPSSSSASSSASAVTLDEPTYAVLSEMASSRDAVCASEAMRVLGRVVAMSPANQEFVASRLNTSVQLITVAPASSSSASSSSAAKSSSAPAMSSSLAGAVRSSNAYLQMLAVKLITTLCAATATAAAATDASTALLALLPSASMRTPASDLLCRETARLVRNARGTTATSAARPSDKLALPALSAVPKSAAASVSGKAQLSVRPAFTEVNAALDTPNASALAESF